MHSVILTHFVVEFLEFEGDFGVAEVGDRAYVGVAYAAHGAVGAVLHFEAHFLVGFTEAACPEARGGSLPLR